MFIECYSWILADITLCICSMYDDASIASLNRFEVQIATQTSDIWVQSDRLLQVRSVHCLLQCCLQDCVVHCEANFDQMVQTEGEDDLTHCNFI